MTRVLVVRHPPVHRAGRCIGQSAVPVTMDVQEAAAQVVQALDLRLRAVVASDLPRCRDLAQRIASELALPLELDVRLREMHFGEWEGQTFDAISKRDPQRWQAWCEHWIETRPPGGESAQDLTDRVRAWLRERQPDPHQLVVTHAGVVRALRVLGGSSWPTAMQTDVPFLVPHAVNLPAPLRQD